MGSICCQMGFPELAQEMKSTLKSSSGLPPLTFTNTRMLNSHWLIFATLQISVEFLYILKAHKMYVIYCNSNQCYKSQQQINLMGYLRTKCCFLCNRNWTILGRFLYFCLYFCVEPYQTLLSLNPDSGFVQLSSCQKRKKKKEIQSFCKLRHSVGEQADKNKMVTLCRPRVRVACFKLCTALLGRSTRRCLSILNHQCLCRCEKKEGKMLNNAVMKHVAKSSKNM